MSYAIGNIIYGIPITEQAHFALENDENIKSTIEEDIGYLEVKAEDIFEDFGFEILYTASGVSSGFCGAKLCSINECSDIRFDKIISKPTKEAKNKADEKIKALPVWLREILPEVGVYIVWSNS